MWCCEKMEYHPCLPPQLGSSTPSTQEHGWKQIWTPIRLFAPLVSVPLGRPELLKEG